MVKRMMQEEKSAAVRAEAEKYKRELAEAARQREVGPQHSEQQCSILNATVQHATVQHSKFALFLSLWNHFSS